MIGLFVDRLFVFGFFTTDFEGIDPNYLLHKLTKLHNIIYTNDLLMLRQRSHFCEVRHQKHIRFTQHHDDFCLVLDN